MQEGNLVVISGPSGTGKGTICKELLNCYNNIIYSISATTREPRIGEKHGINYWFTSKEDFKCMIADEKLLEWAEVYGNYYGTPVERVREMLIQGKDVLLEIDTQGAMQVKKKFPEAIYIFILPPSLRELEDRIKKRGTDSLESIERRLKAASEEIAVAYEYKYVIINDVVNVAVEKIIAILKAEKCNIMRNQELIKNISENKGE